MTDPKNEESKMGCPEDAEERFQEWKDKDPYPHIPPALLNSADIHDYVETTGMMYPYCPRLMKSSSYEARIGDKAFFWGDDSERIQIKLDKTSPVELKPNSLVFIETKEEFRLPPYMAIRFNLRITNVHRGLLLGTGPLVDPGFKGKLLIPIHNLTQNTYSFYGDDKFIWIEFTKISRNDIWDQKLRETVSQHGVYEPFPESKKNKSPSDYFEKANKGNSIRNAIPAALVKIQKKADAAEEQAGTADEAAATAQKTVKVYTVGGMLGVAAILAAVFSLIYNSVGLSNDVSNTISDFRDKFGENTRTKIAGQQNQIDALEKQIGALRNQLNRYKTLQTRPPPPPQSP